MAIERFELDTDTHAVVPRVPTHEMVMAGYYQQMKYDQRAEMYQAMLAAAPRPEAVRQSTPLSDAELVDLIYRAGLGHTSDLLYEKSKDGIEVDYPTVEARKLAAFLMQQPAKRPVPTASIEQAPDVLSEAIHYVGNKDLGGLVTREFLSGANAIIKALEEYRDEISRAQAWSRG